ncbi:MAG: enoyl-CoA hydratase/isomerase family protein [Ignavibacteria bacterium]|nr:enoyl-CoA hydratase/isomerase family protein [Ignavibacteria bacterium]
MHQVVTIETQQHVALITINRPDKLNALNGEVLNQLSNVVRDVRFNNVVRVVVITGNGPKAFVAGADIAELHELDELSGSKFTAHGQDIFSLIERLGKPVIAAVNGFALGGGCELALACHMRFASDTAKFGQPEINLGIIPGYGGTQRLARTIGVPKALELILSGTMIDSAEALSVGLVNRVYPSAELLPSTLDFAHSLAAKAPLALTACLEATLASYDTTRLDGQYIEAQLFSRICGTSDFKEGTAAFLEKRQPLFEGR